MVRCSQRAPGRPGLASEAALCGLHVSDLETQTHAPRHVQPGGGVASTECSVKSLSPKGQIEKKRKKRQCRSRTESRFKDLEKQPDGGLDLESRLLSPTAGQSRVFLPGLLSRLLTLPAVGEEGLLRIVEGETDFSLQIASPVLSLLH